jgi:hypothetical protein
MMSIAGSSIARRLDICLRPSRPYRFSILAPQKQNRLFIYLYERKAGFMMLFFTEARKSVQAVKNRHENPYIGQRSFKTTTALGIKIMPKRPEGVSGKDSFRALFMR